MVHEHQHEHHHEHLDLRVGGGGEHRMGGPGGGKYGVVVGAGRVVCACVCLAGGCWVVGGGWFVVPWCVRVKEFVCVWERMCMCV